MKISILGAGVGGLSTAIALKLKGCDVEIFERHSVLSDIGAGIVCWPNASFVLHELGMLDDIERVSGRPTRMQRVSESGESLGFVDILKLNEHMGYPSFSILRRDLMKILSRRASELGIEVLYNHRVVAIDSNTDSLAQISFDNGTRIQSEVVIGADGRMDSVARQFVLGNNTPVYQGFINWIGVFESEQAVFEDIAVSDYWGIGERFGIVPISANKAYWAGGVAAKKIGDRNPKQYKAELITAFKGWPDPIAMIIEETPLTRINKIYVHDHNPMDAWHRANVLLVGDAAHAPLPTSGQGACQALE
ncbi:MAG: FAD-dependent monooxygenase, partial [Gammaproteobacteria bacterium]|nr:FAD-dependent monooxygenase [Gammaproteobacteria bacterium]